MCNPAVAMAAVAVASSLAQSKAQADAASAHNAATAQTHENARIAANNQYTNAQARHVQQVREAQNEAYDASLEKNAAVALGRAAAGSSGVSGISVDALLASEAEKGARNVYKIEDKMDYSTVEYLNNVNSAKTEGDMRIAANPFVSGPSTGGMLLDAAFKGGTAYFMAGGKAPGMDGIFSIGGTNATGAMPSNPGVSQGPSDALTKIWGR
jgi:hypothetical protein